jgi:photosystem II stability/assembly factor-like uncharacterized protein
MRVPASHVLLTLAFGHALAACGSPPEPSPLPPARAATPAPVPSPVLPPTSTAGTPYVWKNVVILGGGFVSGIVFSPVRPGLAYARTDVGGAYRMNPDRSFTPLTDHFGRADSNLTGVESIAPDPTDANKVYAAVGTYTQDFAGKGAILRSNNQGADWQRTDMPIKMGGNENGRSNGERLAIDPNAPNILYFGSRRDGLWKSSDGAVSFQKVESFPLKEDAAAIGVVFVLFDAKSGAAGKPTPRLYAGVGKPEANLYESTDAGATWAPVPKHPSGLVPSHAAFDAKGALYLTYGNRPGPSDVTTGAVYKYDPKSKRFANITPQKPTDDLKFGYGGLAVDAQKPGTLVVTTIDRWTGGDEAFRTTNGGANWKPLWDKAEFAAGGARYLYYGREKLDKPHWTGDVDIDPFDSNHATVVGGTGVFATSDLTLADAGKATHWNFRNRGLEETVVIDLVSPPKGAKLLSGVGDICGFRHDDLDVSPPAGAFLNPPCKTTKSLDVAAGNPDVVVRVGDVWGEGAHGAVSTDGGTSFVPFPSEPKNASKGGEVAISANGQTILWSTKGSTPHVSRDRGKSWFKAVGLPEAEDTPDWVSSDLRPAFDSRDPTKAYVLDSGKGEIYVSEDGGASFERTTRGLSALADIERISARIVPVPGVEGDVWVSTTKDLQRSTDWGRTFAPLGTVDESFSVGFGKGPPGASYPSVYLVGKVRGVYGFFRSDDVGATWVRINDDEHQFGWVSVITGDPRVFGRVYVGSGGRGILYGDPRK